jgi:hypothetical protein
MAMNGLVTPSIASPLPVRSGKSYTFIELQFDPLPGTLWRDTFGYNSNCHALLDFKH